MIKVGSDCSGIGAFIQALKALGIEYTEEFACDFDYYARISYLANYGTKEDLKLAKTKQHKKYADGVKKIALSEEEPTADDIRFLNEANEFAKSFSFYFPFNMYQREIPKDPLDVYVSTVPCQAFSIAGKRKGEEDKRGILFYNSHEFIQKNNPRYFLFENVKGLLSHDKDPNDPKNPIGRTFNKWIQLLGGKSIDGNQVLFPHDDAVPYHIYIKVLNATDFGVPQNRERVFIVGIRDDVDNRFEWPTPIPLEKRLIDVLEDEVDEKYFLKDDMIKKIMGWKSYENPLNNIYGKDSPIMGCLTASGQADLHSGLKLVAHAEKLHGGSDAPTVRKGGKTSLSKKHNHDIVKVGYVNQDTQASQIFDSVGDTPTLSSGTHGYAQGYVKVSSANKKGFEMAKIGDSINLSFPESDTRRGRVGKEVAQTLETTCNQGIIQLNPSKESGGKQPFQGNRIYSDVGLSPSLSSQNGGFSKGSISIQRTTNYQIRRLTPRESLRLMGFPDSYKIAVSDTQVYKQAGNSIVKDVLGAIINNLKLI